MERNRTRSNRGWRRFCASSITRRLKASQESLAIEKALGRSRIDGVIAALMRQRNHLLGGDAGQIACVVVGHGDRRIRAGGGHGLDSSQKP